MYFLEVSKKINLVQYKLGSFLIRYKIQRKLGQRMKTSIVFILGLCLVIGAFAGTMENSGGSLRSYKPPAKRKFTPPKGECLSSFCQTIQKNFTLTAAGKVTLNFEVNIAEKSTAKTPVAYVKWNGVVVYTIYACDTTKSVSIQVDGKVGCNTLVFCSVGGAPVCAICFTNICVSLSICNPGTSGNLVKNGNFTDVSCNDILYCQFDVNNIDNNVPWWIPDDKVVVANPTTLNSQAFNSSNKWVASLMAYPQLPTGTAQIVTMTPGVTATLEFTYAPVITGSGGSTALAGNAECYNFQVIFNGVSLGKFLFTSSNKPAFAGTDVQLDIPVNLVWKVNVLQFKSLAEPNCCTYGTLIDDVAITQTNACATTTTVNLTPM